MMISLNEENDVLKIGDTVRLRSSITAAELEGIYLSDNIPMRNREYIIQTIEFFPNYPFGKVGGISIDKCYAHWFRYDMLEKCEVQY